MENTTITTKLELQNVLANLTNKLNLLTLFYNKNKNAKRCYEIQFSSYVLT